MSWGNHKSHANTPQHQALKRWALTNLPYTCNTPGCTADENLELDHILNWKAGGQHTTNNIQWLCNHHHKQKTQQEAAQHRQPYKRTPKPPLGT